MRRRRKKALKAGKNNTRSVQPNPYEFRLTVTRLYLEDGGPAKLRFFERPRPNQMRRADQQLYGSVQHHPCDD